MQFPTLSAELHRFASLFQSGRVKVAFSGGLDSTVLLHALAQDPTMHRRLQAIYIDHQLQAESAQWAEHCAAICKQLMLPFEAIQVQLSNQSRQGVEARARQARYQALYSKLSVSEVLLTAHHQRDQAETFLLNLQRGSGVAGLAAMPYQKSVALNQSDQSWHVRPLLHVPYAELVAYAKAFNLKWIEDPSNAELNFKRNQVRHQWLPVLQQACPTIEQQIQRAAAHQSEAMQLLQRLAEQDMQQGAYNALYIDLNSYQTLDWSGLKNVLRHWAKKHFNLSLSYDHLQWIQLHTDNQSHSLASLQLRDGSLRLYRKRLYYVIEAKTEYAIPMREIIETSGLTERLTASECFSVELPAAWLEGELSRLTIRALREDDSANSKRLKKWFQQMGIPAWQRQWWPVLAHDDQPLLLWGAEGIFNTDKTQSLQVELSTARTLLKTRKVTLSIMDIERFSHA